MKILYCLNQLPSAVLQFYLPSLQLVCDEAFPADSSSCLHNWELWRV